MAMSPNILDLERDKFLDSPTRPNKTAVEVFGSLTAGGGPFDAPANAVKVSATIGALIETYVYKDALDLPLKTFTITYADVSKEGNFEVVIS